MEGFPFRLSLSLIIAAAVVGLSWYMLTLYLDAQVKQKFAHDLLTLNQTINTLVSTGDLGSFDRVTITVPSGCSITIPGSGHDFTASYFGTPLTFETAASFLWSNTYLPGEYPLTVVKTDHTDYVDRVYPSKTKDERDKIKSLTIGFR